MLGSLTKLAKVIVVIGKADCLLAEELDHLKRIVRGPAAQPH